MEERGLRGWNDGWAVVEVVVRVVRVVVGVAIVVIVGKGGPL